MTTSAKHDRAAEAVRARGVHMVDALNGPLIGEGRLSRVMPFAVTASISMAIAVPTASWMRPGWAVAGSVIMIVAIIGSIFFPCPRVPRRAQVAVPLLILVGTLMLLAATGNGIGSPFITMSVLPLMWLAIYEDKTAVVAATAIAGIALWLDAPTNPAPLTGGFVPTAVLMICLTGMGVTLHGLVANARKLTVELRGHQYTLEQAEVVLNSLPDLVNRYRVSDHVITYCNTVWAKHFNVEASTAIGTRLEVFLSADEKAGLDAQLALLGPDDPILVDSVARASHGGSGQQWLEWMDRYVIGVDGPEVLSIGRDVTRRRQAEIDLAASEAEFRDMADKSADVVWRFGFEPTPHFDYMSPSSEAILGYPPSFFLDDFNHIFDVLDEAGRTAVKRALQGHLLPAQFDFHYRHANGSIVVGETRTAIVRGGLQGVSRDVTELRRLQDEMAALALRDPLTGLANRRLFTELLDADLARTQRSNLPLAVAFLDLDGFKTVNDLHGHDAGDVVLRETGRRLLQIVRGADTVARLGGDEFVIVYAPNDANSFNLIARIDRSLSEPIWITATKSVVCPASIGVADTTAIGYDGKALLAAADKAMYETKRARQAIRHTEPVTASR